MLTTEVAKIVRYSQSTVKATGVTIFLTLLSAGLTAFIVIPSPILVLVVLNLAAAELSPCLLLLNLLTLALAVRFCRKIIPVALVALCLAAYPIYQISSVRLDTNRPSAWTMPAPSAFSVLSNCAHSISPRLVQSRKLPLNILFYPPQQPGNRTAVVDIYGGAWQHGAPEDTAQFDSYLALRGFAVFAIDYRHAPQFRFPTQIQDVQTALRFLSSHAADYNIDPARLILCGRSAGAELALLAAYEPGGVPIRAVIGFYPPTDLESGYRNIPSPDPIDVRAVLRTYLGGSPAEKPAAYRDSSPVHYMRSSLPPTLLIQGSRDHIVKSDFALELYNKLDASGNSASLLTIPWSEHAFDLIFFGLGNQVCLPYVDDFLLKQN